MVIGPQTYCGIPGDLPLVEDPDGLRLCLNGCVHSGQPQGLTPGSPATFGRASAAWYRQSSGVWAAVSSGVARQHYVGDDGRPRVLLEPERTNAVEGALTDANANNIPDGNWAANGATAGVDMFLDASEIGPGMMARWNATNYAGWEEVTARVPSPAKAAYSLLIKNSNETVTNQILFRGQAASPVYIYSDVTYTSAWSRFKTVHDLSAFTSYLSAVSFQLNTSVGVGVKYLAGLTVEYEADWCGTPIFSTAIDTTRVAETLTVGSAAIDPNEGSAYMRFVVPFAYNQPSADVYVFGAGANHVAFFDQSAAKWAVTLGGVTFALSAAAETFAADDEVELAWSWRQGKAPYGWANRGARQTGSSAYSAPTAATVYVGSDHAGGNQAGIAYDRCAVHARERAFWGL